jgi:type I restriction enzyme R subunit
MTSSTPEQRARANIDRLLKMAGWAVQDLAALNVHAARGVAVREFSLRLGHGTADYLLYVDGWAAGVVEAKPEGFTLTGVESQSGKYGAGLPDNLPAYVRPLPFLYESTGVETRFSNGLDPEPRSRPVFAFHTPKTLAEWLGASVPSWDAGERQVAGTQASYTAPYSLRSRLAAMPALDESGLWPVQARAIRNLEQSLAEARPRSLVQMATGNGKMFMGRIQLGPMSLNPDLCSASVV